MQAELVDSAKQWITSRSPFKIEILLEGLYYFICSHKFKNENLFYKRIKFIDKVTVNPKFKNKIFIQLKEKQSFGSILCGF